MRLIDLKKHIESFKGRHEFEYSLSEPFTWKGSYDEIAFNVIKEKSTKEQILSEIMKSYTATFERYTQGGKNKYSDETLIHFEKEWSSYSDGEYCKELLNKFHNEIIYESEEEKLIRKSFI